MKIIKTPLQGVLLIEPRVFDDARGYFMETYQKDRYQELGIEVNFVQDNLSFSKEGTLRGLHYQYPQEQAKLMQVIRGEVFDVAVDVRLGSPTFGRWYGSILSAENKRQMFVPTGFAHGFCVLSRMTVYLYKCSDYYAPDCEWGMLWSDTDIGIDWPIKNPLLSDKDANFPRLKDIPKDRLPIYEERPKAKD
jgi:dTDP-4-dehydrorhamnose 3,5-epimerase